MRALIFVVVVTGLVGCGTSGRKAGSCDGPCPESKINHLIVIEQENHTFDNYFAKYCTAPASSAPTCTTGPGCCEAGPAMDPSGASPVVLDDGLNGVFDPDHEQACELQEIDGGKMDQFTTGTACSDARTFAYADATTVQPYWTLASGGALADHYFQPIAGQSSSNDMYLVRAQFVFLDNAYDPAAIGASCALETHQMEFPGPIIGDLLDGANVSWSFYAEGYADMVTAVKAGTCPQPPADCPFDNSLYPCIFDPGDVPIEYYANYKDNPRVLRDFTQFSKDLSAGKLPQVTWLRGIGYHSEHPGQSTTISDGVTWVSGVLKLIAASDYAPDTLVLVTWDEGGGSFDHRPSRRPLAATGSLTARAFRLIATGPMVRKNFISHTTMEHSSIVKFIEWNWLKMQTGGLSGRDVQVNNLGSLLDPTVTGVAIPE